jgi:hypothetical protein
VIRRIELDRARALQDQIATLRATAEFAPGAKAPLEERIAELRAKRLALRPPLVKC